MADVVKHASTHRLRGYGGTDPITPELPYIYAHDNGTGQTVTADAELEFNAAITNDEKMFGIDLSGNQSGVLIRQPGLFMVLADVYYAVGSIGVSRAIYTAWARESAGALAALGNELNPGIGTGQGSAATFSGISEVGNVAKSRLSHYAIALLNVSGLDPLTVDPFRLVVILDHRGVNFTTGNGANSSGVTVVRLSGGSRNIDFTP